MCIYAAEESMAWALLISNSLPPSGLGQQLLEGRQNPLTSYVRSQNASGIVHHAAHPAKAIHLPCAQPIDDASLRLFRFKMIAA